MNLKENVLKTDYRRSYVIYTKDNFQNGTKELIQKKMK